MNTLQVVSIPALAVISFAWVSLDKYFVKIMGIKPSSVTYDSATKAIERMAGFTTWLTGLQTAAIAAMGLLIKNKMMDGPGRIYGFYAILFFGASIALSTWVLSSLPSIQSRLVDSKNASEANDIYTLPIFSFVRINLGGFTGLIHTYFLIGIIFFGVFIFHVLNLGPCPLPD